MISRLWTVGKLVKFYLNVKLFGFLLPAKTRAQGSHRKSRSLSQGIQTSTGLSKLQTVEAYLSHDSGSWEVRDQGTMSDSAFDPLAFVHLQGSRHLCMLTALKASFHRPFSRIIDSSSSSNNNSIWFHSIQKFVSDDADTSCDLQVTMNRNPTNLHDPLQQESFYVGFLQRLKQDDIQRVIHNRSLTKEETGVQIDTGDCQAGYPDEYHGKHQDDGHKDC
ncbi:hypothetical protein U0070_004005 [Myodes glareolus]|uniref:Uncharacterized protein n=1 Tax=Myodes glareolus TaxID=447135 RepID=A0AAW0KA70_MYOGA